MKCIFVLLGMLCLQQVQADGNNLVVNTYEKINTVLNQSELAREEGQPPIVYYFIAPNAPSYPILIFCGANGAEAAAPLCPCITERTQKLNAGLLVVEKWGERVDLRRVWMYSVSSEHDTPSQRLKDHERLIVHLIDNPPAGWNGKLILIGEPEDGALVTALTTEFSEKMLATACWGAGDFPWKEEVWQLHESMRNASWKHGFDAYIPKWLPFSCDVPKTRLAYEVLLQDIVNNPTPHKWLAGRTYLYHADALQRPSIDYSKIKTPFLLVMGAKSSNLLLGEQFVQMAQQAGAPVVYQRVEGLGHMIRVTEGLDILDDTYSWLEMQKISAEQE